MGLLGGYVKDSSAEGSATSSTVPSGSIIQPGVEFNASVGVGGNSLPPVTTKLFGLA